MPNSNIEASTVVVKTHALRRMVVITTIVGIVEALSGENCPDCGCAIDDHNEDFCMNCGERCDIE